jgi:hypothetical protein
MESSHTLQEVFDDSHYAGTVLAKLKRSLQLGPKYYLVDLPRYLRHRRVLNLPVWDFDVLANPLREFRARPDFVFPVPPAYDEALAQLAQAGICLTMPRNRLEALVGAWWATQGVASHVIECGSYRGATALLIAVLGRLQQTAQTVHMLDTFTGIPDTSRFDVGRRRGEFIAPDGQVAAIQAQADALQVRNRIEVHRGLFSETFDRLKERDLRFAFVHVDANIYQGTWEACQFAIPRTARGGIVVFDDYNGVCDLGARLAIDHYLAPTSVKPKPLAGSSAWIKVAARA